MWSAPDALRSDGHPRIRSDSLWWLTVCENGSFSSLVYLLNIFKHDDLPLSYSFLYVYRSVTWGFTNKTTWKPSVKPGTSRFMVGFRRVNPVDPRWPGSTLKAIARHSLGWSTGKSHEIENQYGDFWPGTGPCHTIEQTRSVFWYVQGYLQS